jgi:purine catabolism regulator
MKIHELIANPLLKTQLLAGRDGRDRPVNWAHTSEVKDPWNWLGEGDLLLTTGHNVPDEPEAQVEFIEKLDNGRLSGIAIGEDFYAPPVSAEAKKTADDLGFPILETAHEIPFALVAQTVAEHSATAGTALMAVMRIYETYRALKLTNEHDQFLLDVLGTETDARYHVIDLDTSTEIMGTRAPLTSDIIAAIVDSSPAPGHRIPAYTRVRVTEAEIGIIQPLVADKRIVLLALTTGATRSIELQLFQHVAALVQAEAEHHVQARTLQRFESSQLLTSLLHKSSSPADLEQKLVDFGIQGDQLQILCTSSSNGQSHRLESHLLNDGIGFLCTERHDGVIYLIDQVNSDRFCQLLSEHAGAHAGASSIIYRLTQIPDACREARWALEAAQSNGTNVALYESSVPRFLPRTLHEAENVVREILGPVIQHDTEHSSELLETLETFFQEDKSWVRTARRMNIHKQTAVYRMQRIEKLLERKVADIEDQTTIYLALKTYRLTTI